MIERHCAASTVLGSGEHSTPPSYSWLERCGCNLQWQWLVKCDYFWGVAPLIALSGLQFCVYLRL